MNEVVLLNQSEGPKWGVYFKEQSFMSWLPPRTQSPSLNYLG
jgi:hypothetical protein